MLFRLTYVREGRERSLTFFAADLIAMLEFEAIWTRMAKASVIGSKPTGQSRFVDRGGRTVLRKVEPNLGN